MAQIIVEPILPEGYDFRAVKKELYTAMEEEAEKAQQLFRKTTRYWRGDKPTWKIRIFPRGDDVIVQVRPSGSGTKKWIYIDQGTRPHTIRPRRASMLAFPANSISGSKPGSLKTGPGLSFGPTIYARSVRHPGIKAREWSELVAKKRTPDYQRRLVQVLKRTVVTYRR